MADGAGVRVPDVQLGHGDLPVGRRPRRGGVRGGVVPGPGAALRVPPHLREDAAGVASPGRAQGLRVGAHHAAHRHVLAQGRRHHAAAGGARGLGHGLRHHRRRLLRLLHPPGQGRPTGGGGEPVNAGAAVQGGACVHVMKRCNKSTTSCVWVSDAGVQV